MRQVDVITPLFIEIHVPSYYQSLFFVHGASFTDKAAVNTQETYSGKFVCAQLVLDGVGRSAGG